MQGDFVSTHTCSFQSKQSGLAKSLFNKPGKTTLMEMGKVCLQYQEGQLRKW